MTFIARNRLFDVVFIWTAITTIFAWLPLLRIVGRAEGYTWGILGLSGEGTDGPYWIFIVSTVYVVTLLFSAFRGPRSLFYPLLLLWHGALTAIVIAAVALGGAEATWQGQGLHWEIPMWMLTVPFVLFTAGAVVWVGFYGRSGDAYRRRSAWGRGNTRRLVVSLALLPISLVLFRLGNNYNWVTALAILFAIAQWVVMVKAFEYGENRAG